MQTVKRVMVTGVSGFIGPHIVRSCLGNGWHVIGISRSDYPDKHYDGFTFIKKETNKLSEVDFKNIDYVFHLAFATNIPHSIEKPVETTGNNIDGTVRLLDLATRAGVKKFIFASTASVYGNNPIPWRENMSPDPIEPYSWQKLSCEYACRMWYKRYGLPTVILRLFQVFGENQRKDTVLSFFLKAKKEGQPFTLTNAGTSRHPKSLERDFVYAGDVAEAFQKAAESKNTSQGEIINIASGKATPIEDIAKVIGGKIAWISKRSYEVDKHQADITLAKKLLAWQPKVDVLSWLKNNPKML